MAQVAEAIVSQNNLNLAKSFDSLLAVRNDIAHIATMSAVLPDFSWLAQDIGQICQSLVQVTNNQFGSLVTLQKASLVLPPVDRFIAPTGTVAYYAISARSLVEADTESNLAVLSEQGFEENGDQKLDILLGKLNPDYIEMRQGSWAALAQRGPDRLRHAATSQRELTRQLLQELVSARELPKENREGPQLKITHY